MTASTRNRWSIPGWILLLLVLGSGGVDAEQRRDGSAAEPMPEVLLPPAVDGRLAEQGARLEKVVDPARRIRDVYQAFEHAAVTAGHEFELDVLEVETLAYSEFSSSKSIDLLSPPTGGWIDMHPTYFDAPWMDGDRVLYELEWREREIDGERTVFRWLEEVAGESFRQTLERELRQRRRERVPIAVTSYRARVRLGDRERTYRAAGFWYGKENGDFELEVHDSVVSRVSDAMAETARIASREELEEFQRGGPRRASSPPDSARPPCSETRQP